MLAFNHQYLFLLIFAVGVAGLKHNCDLENEEGRGNCLISAMETHHRLEREMELMKVENAFMKERMDALMVMVKKQLRPGRQLTTIEEPGVTYVRWGKDTCPWNITVTQRVYMGIAGGSRYNEDGGGSNYLCLSREPEWNRYSDRLDELRGNVWGAEYHIEGYNGGFPFDVDLHDGDVPCAVCLAKRSAVLMIPGQITCPFGWTKEYSGYLMAARHAQHKSEYVCMDEKPEVLPGSGTNQDGVLFANVEGRCGSLLCPPYVNGREITCVVCTK